MLKDLENFVANLVSEKGTEIIKMDVTSDHQVTLAICTPLMKRILQQVQQSGEMVFVDSSGNMDRHTIPADDT